MTAQTEPALDLVRLHGRVAQGIQTAIQLAKADGSQRACEEIRMVISLLADLPALLATQGQLGSSLESLYQRLIQRLTRNLHRLADEDLIDIQKAFQQLAVAWARRGERATCSL